MWADREDNLRSLDSWSHFGSDTALSSGHFTARPSPVPLLDLGLSLSAPPDDRPDDCGAASGTVHGPTWTPPICPRWQARPSRSAWPRVWPREHVSTPGI